GIDMAILPQNIGDYIQNGAVGNSRDLGIYYITKLYNQELHILAQANVGALKELANKTVSVDVPGSASAITTAQVFRTLGIPVVLESSPPELGIKKLREGRVAAVSVLSGKPAPLFSSVSADDHLHFLSVPFDGAAADGKYLPSQLEAIDYPQLISAKDKVETVAVGAVLAVAD